jgi:hypothetical protein
VTVLAAIRPDDVNLALLFHVLGAMLLLGGLVTAATAGIAGWREDTNQLQRLAYKTLLLVAFPGFVLMRLAAEWVYREENLDAVPEEPAWIGIGYMTADLGGLLLLVSLVLGGIGVRRGGGGALLKAVVVLATLLVAVYVVAVWAMGAKPT